MHTRHVSARRPIAAILFAIVAFHAVAFAQDQTASPTVAPNVELWDQDTITVKYDGDLLRHTSCRMWDRVVAIDWSASNGAACPANSLADQSETYATTYWPHIVLPTDRYQLCVAGLDSAGATILERWTFANRTTDGIAAPSLTTKPGAWVWTLPPRTRVDPVLTLPRTSTHGMIRGLVPSLKSADQVFVYFDASRELASIHLNSRAMTIVASPKTAPGSLSVPALAEDYRTFWSADYRERGYCYIFSDSQERPSPKPPPGILVIIDSDRDGSVDKSVLVSGEQWSSDGWGKHENVVPSSRGL